ncbi:MAG: ABC transporter substrate-binding protein [Candidatus Merdivicinus sp.]|jgi:branched-chain amino acid transport system substrate-binding protein
MKKFLSVLCAAALSAGVLAGCGGSGSNGNKVEEGASSIKIGLSYELTGAVATYGQSSVDGVKMAIDEVNAAGGINGKTIELVEYDTKSDEAEATTLGKRLMGQDKVLAILGPATSGAFKAEIPDANNYKVPVISGSATANDVTVANGKVQEYAFRICFSDSYQGGAMARYAAENLGAKTAVIYKDSGSDYAIGLAEGFTKSFTEAGGSILKEESYSTNDKDFKAVLTSIKDLNADVIFIPGYYQQAGLIIKQARELGIDVPILGADGFDSPDLIGLAGAENLNNVFFTNHYSSLDQDPTVQGFIAAFKEKYGREPDAFNALGYDEAKFLCDALSRCESLDSVSLQKALSETKDFKAVTGTLSVDENHDAVKEIVVIELQNGVQYKSEKVG